jgi:hypothetical protein
VDTFLQGLSDSAFRAGATYAVLFFGIFLIAFFALNKWRGWWVSAGLWEAEKKRADSAEASMELRSTAMLLDLNNRMDKFRDDQRMILAQQREDHDQAFDRQADTYKAVIAAKEQDIEFLRTAWHIADQGGSEEMLTLIRKIEAHMAATSAHMALSSRFFTAFQQQTGVPQLTASDASEGGST